MDFRYIITIVTAMVFYPAIDGLVSRVNYDWVFIASLIGYGAVCFFIFPLMLDNGNR